MVKTRGAQLSLPLDGKCSPHATAPSPPRLNLKLRGCRGLERRDPHGSHHVFQHLSEQLTVAPPSKAELSTKDPPLLSPPTFPVCGSRPDAVTACGGLGGPPAAPFQAMPGLPSFPRVPPMLTSTNFPTEMLENSFTTSWDGKRQTVPSPLYPMPLTCRSPEVSVGASHVLSQIRAGQSAPGSLAAQATMGGKPVSPPPAGCGQCLLRATGAAPGTLALPSGCGGSVHQWAWQDTQRVLLSE